LKLLIIGDEISKLPALRRAVHSHKLHKHVRFLGFLPTKRSAPLSPCGAVRLPVALRGFRPAAARGDGERHAGRDVQRVVAAEVAGDAAVLVDPYNVGSIVDGMRRVLSDHELASELRRKGWCDARDFSWERSVARTHQDLSPRGGWQ
jgi:glycosyltransferase involved in cell wall biosynthesis